MVIRVYIVTRVMVNLVRLCEALPSLPRLEHGRYGLWQRGNEDTCSSATIETANYFT